MTARKQIKRQHRREREEQRRVFERSRLRRRLLHFGVAVAMLAVVGGGAFALAPWSGSGEAEEQLPSISLGIRDDYFEPETLRINAGQKYRLNIRNFGRNTHDFWAAGGDGQTETGDDIRTKPISGGGTASEKIQYDNPGTYYFVCTFHAGQGGTLIVEDAASPERSPN